MISLLAIVQIREKLYSIEQSCTWQTLLYKVPCDKSLPTPFSIKNSIFPFFVHHFKRWSKDRVFHFSHIFRRVWYDQLFSVPIPRRTSTANGRDAALDPRYILVILHISGCETPTTSLVYWVKSDDEGTKACRKHSRKWGGWTTTSRVGWGQGSETWFRKYGGRRGTILNIISDDVTNVRKVRPACA